MRWWRHSGRGTPAEFEVPPELQPEPPELREPPIFVSGCNRGGTTILARLLAEHPEICNIGTGPFSEGQFVWRQKFPDRSRHRWAVEPWKSRMRKTAADATPELVRFFRARFAHAVGARGRLLEKTPANAVRIPFIDACFPDCHFVHIIRDGRDTVCSLMARKVRFRYAPLQWVGAHETALADLERLPPGRVSILRYEDLLAKPAEVLERLARGCGLRMDEAARRALAGAAARDLRRPASRWPNLSPRQKRYALQVIGDLQTRLGYPTE